MTAPPRPPAVPRLLVLTDRAQCAAAGRTLVDTVRAAVRAGAPAILLREKDLPDPERRDLATTLIDMTTAHGAQLLVASDRDLAVEVGAAGVHLASHDPVPDTVGLLLGRSCHDAAEVAGAVTEAVDYITVSPVATTDSKPGYGPPMGTQGVAALATVAAPVPVLALGGVTPAVTREALDAGAHGVAVMGAVMGAADPARVVTQFLRNLTDIEETHR